MVQDRDIDTLENRWEIMYCLSNGMIASILSVFEGHFGCLKPSQYLTHK